MNILSLFDGMACGMLAFQKAGIAVDNYYAYEIDKYAIQTATHNFPQIQECGDVFNADFAKYSDIDYLIGGSPCTYWSIAQSPDKRETTASGIGWELFSQYVRALHEAKPKFFIYENNKSMAAAIRQSITETFGFEPICINSALVSAQNRQRLYWAGKRNADGTYSKVDVQQPEDRGILLKDVLDGFAIKEKLPCIDANYYKGGNYTNVKKQSGQRMCCAEPVNVTADGKAQCLRATCYKDGTRNIAGNIIDRKTGVAEPVCIASRGRYSDTDSRTNKTDAPTYQHYEARTDGKTNAITTVSKDNLVGEPVRVGIYPTSDGRLLDSQGMRIYSVDAKSVTQSAQGGGMGAKTGLYAILVEFDGDIPTKAVSGADGKTYTVYEVKDGTITIKGKTYPIKLVDGYYIIRKLTVSECKRLQTVPEWYEFPVSNTRAYSMLGNGWTVDAIVHLIEATRVNFQKMLEDALKEAGNKTVREALSKEIKPLNKQEAKTDAGKPQLTLVPRQILFDIAEIRAFGIKKYNDPDNWKKVEIQRYRDAAFRHFMAYLDDPKGNDEESGLSHLAHLACNIAFLCELEKKETNKGNETRNDFGDN